MDPARVRKRVLDDHAALRVTVEEVESVARRVLGGSGAAHRELGRVGERLLESLESHIAWRDHHLLPVLRGAAGWSEEREAQMRRGQREQRQVLRYLLDRLHDRQRPHHLLARNLLDFSALLRNDMAEEEQALLESDAQQDDVLGAGLEAS
jgi:hemerythrin-like domain-containing protein